MKHKTCELTGALLDAAVAQAEGRAWRIDPEQGWCVSPREPRALNRRAGDFDVLWQPSTEWTDGGPIIEREGITILKPAWLIEVNGFFAPGGFWVACIAPEIETDGLEGEKRPVIWCVTYGAGPTPLIAAMRAYVASKLGDEVELP